MTGIFAPLLPYAATNNLRLILLNLRDHKGSTPFSDQDRSNITSGIAETQVDFMKQRVAELAAFFVWIIEKEKISPLREVQGKRTGGFSLVAWSGGNAYATTFFAYAESIPQEQRELLEKHMRSYVLYGPHSSSC